MQNMKTYLVCIFLMMGSISRGQDDATIQSYINTYKEIAISEMQRTGVPASIKLAQGIHETLAGTSDLVMKSNNHFGIKCKNTWLGASVTHDDDLRGECFRKYLSALDSYRDHSDFLKNGTRYSFLFKLEPTDYKDWAYGLKKAGYATNPRYPQVIIKLIEDYHLQDYTLIAMGKTPVVENEIAKTTPEIQVKEPDVVFTTTEKNDEPLKTEIKQSEKINEQSGEAERKQQEKKNERLVKAEIKQTGKIIEQPRYPEGEFKINETRVIYVKQGTSFLAIAEQYDVPLARLFEFNDLTESEAVNKNQLIYLQRKRKTGNNEFHIIQQGETLHDIAQLEAIRLETLLEYNLLKSDMQPALGEKLYLRTKATMAPQLVLDESHSLYSNLTGSVAMNTYDGNISPVNPTSANAITYIVQPKETIYAISKKYNVNIDDIVKWNQLGNYDLKTGQQIRIYK